jgi:hypothetical protein
MREILRGQDEQGNDRPTDFGWLTIENGKQQRAGKPDAQAQDAGAAEADSAQDGKDSQENAQRFVGEDNEEDMPRLKSGG